jgi:hypothetical protein
MLKGKLGGFELSAREWRVFVKYSYYWGFNLLFIGRRDTCVLPKRGRCTLLKISQVLWYLWGTFKMICELIIERVLKNLHDKTHEDVHENLNRANYYYFLWTDFTRNTSPSWNCLLIMFENIIWELATPEKVI